MGPHAGPGISVDFRIPVPGRSRYNLKNIVMMICLAGSAAPAASADAVHRAVEIPRNVAVTVRADSRSGRLVRSAVVAPRLVASRAIQSKVVAPRVVTAPPPAPQKVDLGDLIHRTAASHGVDPLLVRSVIEVESNFNPVAVSPKGAEGLMQLIPSTARRFGVNNSFNVAENVEAGVKYLRYLQDLFGDNRLALAAYNAGEGAVLKYRDIPPYRETEQYVYLVGKKYGEAKRAARRGGAPASAPAETADADAPRPIEAFVDESGRFHLRTR
jgi:soluble lytic murein transglycosylase-like protein